MLKIAATYILTLLFMLLIDGTWIGLVALPMFRSTLGRDMLTARPLPGILFYLIYAAGVDVFVLPMGQGAWPTTALYGVLFGLVTYATYDLTNYTTLKVWTLPLAASDIAWGMVMTAVVSILTLLVSPIVLRWIDR